MPFEMRFFLCSESMTGSIILSIVFSFGYGVSVCCVLFVCESFSLHTYLTI